MKAKFGFGYKTKIFSLILALLIIFYILPLPILAETDFTDGENAINEQTSAEIPSADTDVEVIELQELRTESVKHFKLGDGSYIAASYNIPVHYMDDDGKWQDINNRLAEASGEYSTSDARIKFVKKISGNDELFTLHDGNKKITMGLVGAKKMTLGELTGDHSSDELESTQLGKLTNLENLKSSITYKNILDGVDLEYVVHSLNVKENIIVKEKKDSYAYTFSIKLNNLTASLNSEDEILISDADGNTAYHIPAPLVYDAANTLAPEDASFYTLTDSGGGKYTLNVTVSAEWMNSEERVFPVTVDPTIGSGADNISDLYVAYDGPMMGIPDAPLVYASSTTKTYIKLNSLPTLPFGAYISSSTLSLKHYMGTSAVISAYKVTSSWDETLCWNDTISDTPEGTIATSMLDYAEVNTAGATYSWDITSAMREWYSGTANYGICLTSSNSTHTMFYSVENGTGYQPAFTIGYRIITGIEDYLTGSSQSAGLAGSGTVTHANGNLVFAVETLTTTDYLMPVTLSLVYNSLFAGYSFAYPNAQTATASSALGKGLKLNIQESVIKKYYTASDGSTDHYYVYTDGDGTQHYFHYDSALGLYTDEDGLLLEMTASSTALTITDRSKISKSFLKLSTRPSSDVSEAWQLEKITDRYGNSAIITYDSSNRPTGISLKPLGQTTPISMLKLAYSSAGALYAIYNETSKEAVILKYSDTYNGTISSTAKTYLRTVIRAHGTGSSSPNWSAYYTSGTTTDISVDATANYSYNSIGCLTLAKDALSGGYLNYNYSGRKVTSVVEYGRGGVKGQQLSFTYGKGYTDVRSSGADDVISNDDDLITRYVLDDEGRTVSTYSGNAEMTEVYSSVTAEYEDQENIKNNIKRATAVGGSGTNFLINGDFEDSYPHWQTVGASRSSNYGNLGTGSYLMMFYPSAGETESAYQYVRLDKGIYTLSFMYTGYGTADVTLTAGADLLDGTSVTSKEFALDGVNVTEQLRGSMQIELSEETELKIFLSVTAGSSVTDATITVDEVMLEEGISYSAFNLVEMGHMEPSYINSSGTAISSAESKWTTAAGNYATLMADSTLFGNVMYISSPGNTEKYFKQRIFTAPSSDISSFGSSAVFTNANVTYMVSAFGKQLGTLCSKAFFGIKVNVYYYQGEGLNDVVVTHEFPFVDNPSSWQFVSGSFSGVYNPTTEEEYNNSYRCIRYIDVLCEFSYDYNGRASFDRICVTNATEDSIVEYENYENGNLKSVTDLYLSTYYYYDEYNNLTKVANDFGKITEYAYDEDGIKLLTETEYDFTNTATGLPYYPAAAEDPDSLITKKVNSTTAYTYNAYGQIQSVSIVGSSGTNSVYRYYTYEISGASKIFGALLSEGDGGVTATRLYYYDTSSGRLLAEVGQSGGAGTFYTYDGLGRLTGAKPASYSTSGYTAETGTENVSYIYDSYGNLSSIVTDSTTYTLTYDVYGNSDVIKAGDKTLADYEYNPNNGKLIKVIYGNGFAEEYVYNSLEILEEIWYTYSDGTRKQAAEYRYTSDGLLHSIDDLLSGRTTVYSYDADDRLIGSSEYDTEDMKNDIGIFIFYNDKNLVSSLNHRFEYSTASSMAQLNTSHSFSYNNDGTLKSSVISDGNTDLIIENYTYDAFDRLSTVTHTYSGFTGRRSYSYKVVDGKTSGLVSAYQSVIKGTSTSYSYTYDANGNITKIVSGSTQIRYVYDNLGQLVREDNGLLNQTYLYTYDKAGNITSKKTYALTAAGTTPTNPTATVTYGYSAGTWGDMLTSYNGNGISYDAIGNPGTYNNGTIYYFAWDGRSLKNAAKGTQNFAFTYNSDGIRNSKTTNGIKHTYYLNGSQIVAEKWGDNLLVFIYDSTGSPIGMRHRTTSYAEGTWTYYWYEKNLQGDIVAVYNNSGIKLVTYKYDAWGNHTVTYSNGGNTAAQFNPFRYRGYYYDTDLGFYYLNSRYYDPINQRRGCLCFLAWTAL